MFAMNIKELYLCMHDTGSIEATPVGIMRNRRRVLSITMGGRVVGENGIRALRDGVCGGSLLLRRLGVL
jgi:hypothetical protein